MKYLLRSEELLVFIIAAYLLYARNEALGGLEAWLLIPLFLLPDVGMAGYLMNPRMGAFSYNLFHHRGIYSLLTATGFYFSIPELEIFGWLGNSHVAMDRMFGFGLKFPDRFSNTHLGEI